MLAKGFKIVDKKRFEVYVESIQCRENEAIIKIDTAAVCKADLRYYLGKRDRRILGLKYPINLLHEAVGIVVRDKSGKFQAGDRVALCPNIVAEEEREKHLVCTMTGLGDNYCPTAKFASSNINGFSRDYISFPISNLIKLPEHVPFEVGVFSEILSVAQAAIRRIHIADGAKIAIWGDGILGYAIYSVLSETKNCHLTVIGHNKSKLEMFKEAKSYTTEEFEQVKVDIDIAFECVGGQGSESAINQIIDTVNPGAKIILTGVSEENIAINTRKVLEKGLAFYGVTRSNVDDFKTVVALFNRKSYQEKVEKLVLSKNPINNIKDFYDVFEREAVNRKLGKHIMKFKF